jgi:hypothetical protein
MTRRTTKEILLEVGAGRERQNQPHGDRATHGDAPHRFHSLQHQPTPPRASIKTRGRVSNDQVRHQIGVAGAFESDPDLPRIPKGLAATTSLVIPAKRQSLASSQEVVVTNF